ncbi:formin-like protein 3 [Salvia splendens]|uniref:formin-like protein 3 n=1 Tax=Salvia splendens TaxID=180675 RepID=UPI001C278D74|nr:formin-like protein 3 [Salvia splendens]
MRTAALREMDFCLFEKAMGARFVAIFIVFICVFAAIDSDGKTELGGNSRDQLQAEQVWDYCSKKLRYSTEAAKKLDSDLSHSASTAYGGVRFGSSLSQKRNIQKAIADLPQKEKIEILKCLRDRKFPLQVLNDEQRILLDECQNLFPGWAGIPRRYLRHKSGIRQVLQTSSGSDPASPSSPTSGESDPNNPSPFDLDYPSPSELDYPPVAMKKYTPMVSQDIPSNNRMYLVSGVIASSMAGIALAALVLFLCVNKDRSDDEPKDVPRDDKPLLNFNGTDSPGVTDNNSPMGAPSSFNFKATSTVGSSVGAYTAASQTSEIEENGEAYMKIPLPLPPGRASTFAAGVGGGSSGIMGAPTAGTAAAAGGKAEAAIGAVGGKAPEPAPAPAPPPTPPPKAVAPPPPPPVFGAPAPPPPPRGSRPPPNAPGKPPPMPPQHGHNSSSDSLTSDDSVAPKAKLKPFFWDKVMASPDQSMVWHEIKAGSFQFDEEMMESLFGYSADQKKHRRKDSTSSESSTPQFIHIIDHKKAQNLSILLKALNVTSEEVCDAMKEGNELPPEFIQNLLKLAPTADEELKLRLYDGDPFLIGPADRFLKALIEIPFAFKRLESLLYVSTFQEDFTAVKQSFSTLEAACDELKNSRLFLKLLEAVLKTGNRMNDGTYRGGAQAFKLDTLLKLSDVKGTDGKTTLLHFVVHEIIRGEGVRAARGMREGKSLSSVRTDDLSDNASYDMEEYYRNLGLQELSSLSGGLLNVKKAAAIDRDIISEYVIKLGQSRFKTKEFLEIEMSSLDEESKFLETLSKFINQCEADTAWLMEEEKRVMGLVRSTGDYFHGSAGKDEGGHLFGIVRDFLAMVDKACLDVKNSIKLPKTQRKDDFTPSLSPSPSQGSPTASETTHEMQSRLFPAMRERQIDDEFSSDDNT